MSLPCTSINVDIYGRCNLQCKFCPEGQGLNEQPALRMSFTSFQQWIGPLLAGLRQIEFFNWSEPLLHDELFGILNWVAEQNPDLKLRLSTNGTLINKDIAERLICSPVQTLTVSIAGLNKEDYFYYHGAHDLERVINSLRVLAVTKERLSSQTPRIRLRYLCFPFNLVSVAEVRRWVTKHLGNQSPFIDRITVRQGHLCGPTLSEEQVEKAYGAAVTGLYSIAFPYYHHCQKAPVIPAVRADGAVFPCCSVPYRKEYIMGFLGKATFQEIWNGALYSQFRKSFIAGENPICRNCFFRYPRIPLKFDRHFLQRVHFLLSRK